MRRIFNTHFKTETRLHRGRAGRLPFFFLFLLSSFGLSCELEDMNIFLRETIYPSPGVKEFQGPALQKLPMGLVVNAGGGNLMLSRTDLSVSTILGEQPITATFNSSDFAWHYSFDLSIQDGVFTDGTGARHSMYGPAGRQIAGTAYIKVSNQSVRTLGGLTHVFGEDGQLEKTYWGTDDGVRLEYKREYLAACGGEGLAIDQCSEREGCSDRIYQICKSPDDPQPTSIMSPRNAVVVIYDVETFSKGRQWLKGVSVGTFLGGMEHRATYLATQGGANLAVSKPLLKADGMKVSIPQRNTIEIGFERLPAGGEYYRRMTSVDYQSGRRFSAQYNFNYENNYLFPVIAVYCNFVNCDDLANASEEENKAGTDAGKVFVLTTASQDQETILTDPEGATKKFTWRSGGVVKSAQGWGAHESYEWYNDQPFSRQLKEHHTLSNGNVRTEWIRTRGGAGQTATVVEKRNGVLQSTTTYEPALNNFYSRSAPRKRMIRELRDAAGVAQVTTNRYYGVMPVSENLWVSGQRGMHEHSRNATGQVMETYTFMAVPDNYSGHPYFSSLLSRHPASVLRNILQPDRNVTVAWSYQRRDGGPGYVDLLARHGGRGYRYEHAPKSNEHHPGAPEISWMNSSFTRTKYDAAGNVVRSYAPNLQEFGSPHPASKADSTPNSGGVEEWSYDSARRMKAIELTQSMCGSNTIELEYRADGQLDYVRRPCGGDTDFVYNADGQLAQRKTKSDGAWRVDESLTYDSLLRQKKRTEGNGRSVTTEYYDYKVSRRKSEYQGQVVDRTYTYKDGQLTRVDSGGFSETYDYDGLGRLQKTIFDDGTQKELDYDNRNRIEVTTYTKGIQSFKLVHGYDDADRPAELYFWGSQVLRLWKKEYDWAGRAHQSEFGNGLTRTFEYNDFGQGTGPPLYFPPNFQLHRTETADASGAQVEVSDGVLDLAETVIHNEDRNWTYRFGTELESQWRWRMTNSDQDRRLSGYDFSAFSDVAPSESVWNQEHNRLLSYGWIEYEYDASGTVTSRAGKALQYNADGQLVQYGDALSIAYDSLGRKASQTYGGESRYWCAGGEIECDASGNWRQLDLGHTVVDFSGGSGHLYRHNDFRGNVLFVSDSGGQVQSRYLYAGYGLDSSEEEYALPVASDRGFAQGQDFGEIMILGARVYDPVAKRFLAQDPIFNPINAYSYTLGNPLEYGDPTGLYFDVLNGNTMSLSAGAVTGATRLILWILFLKWLQEQLADKAFDLAWDKVGELFQGKESTCDQANLGSLPVPTPTPTPTPTPSATPSWSTGGRTWGVIPIGSAGLGPAGSACQGWSC